MCFTKWSKNVIANACNEVLMSVDICVVVYYDNNKYFVPPGLVYSRYA